MSALGYIPECPYDTKEWHEFEQKARFYAFTGVEGDCISWKVIIDYFKRLDMKDWYWWQK